MKRQFNWRNFVIQLKIMVNIKRNMRHPNFGFGLLGYVFLLTGIVLLPMEITLGRQFIIASFIIVGMHWIISIIDILTDRNFENEESRNFWLALVIMVPPLAGMIYYMILERNFNY